MRRGYDPFGKPQGALKAVPSAPAGSALIVRGRWVHPARKSVAQQKLAFFTPPRPPNFAEEAWSYVDAAQTASVMGCGTDN